MEKAKYQEKIKVTVTKADSTELEVTIIPPLAMSMMAVDHIQGDVTKEVNLISNQSGVTVDVISSLPLKEYRKLSEAIQSFL